MTADAQNRAIADHLPRRIGLRDRQLRVCPKRFCESLDAMHLAERSIAGVEALSLRRAYVSNLMRLVGVSPNMHGKWSFIQDFALLHATAPQRAKAFVHAIGKAEEGA